LGKVGLNILSNIGISCILEDRDKYFSVIITSFLLQMIAFTNWINHTCPLRQSSKKAQKIDLFYSWGPQKVSSFYGKPDLSEVIFLWDDSCIAIYQTLKYRHHYILVKAKTVNVFLQSMGLCSKFWAFLHLCLSIADQMHFFRFSQDPAAASYGHKFRWFFFIKFIFENIKVPLQVRRAKSQKDKQVLE